MAEGEPGGKTAGPPLSDLHFLRSIFAELTGEAAAERRRSGPPADPPAAPQLVGTQAKTPGQ